MSLYDDLGVEPKASKDEIRRAYRERAQQAHPDRATSEHDRREREETLKRLNAAYAVLRSPERRERYDSTGKHELPQRVEEQTLARLAILFGAWLDESNIESNNLTNDLLRLLTEGRRSVVRDIGILADEIEKLEKHRRCVECAADRNLFATVVEEKLRSAQCRLDDLQEAVVLFDAVEVEVGKYHYRDTHVLPDLARRVEPGQ